MQATKRTSLLRQGFITAVKGFEALAPSRKDEEFDRAYSRDTQTLYYHFLTLLL